jgi:starch synthase (maltosyl-transferring)
VCVFLSTQLQPFDNVPGEPGDTRVLRTIVIEGVAPVVERGRYPAKRIVGEDCVVEADILSAGQSVLGAVVKWRSAQESSYSEAPMTLVDNDRWRGQFPLTANTRFFFSVEAWTRTFITWRDYFRKKAIAGIDASSDLAEGIALLETVLQRARDSDHSVIADYIVRLQSVGGPLEAVDLVSLPELTAAIDRNEERADAVIYDFTPAIIADRPLARFGAWYEFFPRSQGTRSGYHASLCDAEARLHDVKDMGFDVVYLTPIHPIGIAHRKGPNNSLVAAPDSPGSPWAIGNSSGGHTSIEPKLGTLDDFDHFVRVAERLGLEIALDLAIQCSPNHPWVEEHPEWFRRRPDGSIHFAENPPKQYQDIYQVNFDSSDQHALIEELRRVVLFWIGHGIRIFRVDNPHTKPIAFWEWLIGRIQQEHPAVIFLAEAFTRPKMMKILAKVGFTQSYTYFTWRNNKAEITEYLTELTRTEMVDYFRPNFFTNTPDILPPILQRGGAPVFKGRLVLAATLSPSYGIYSGYELLEHDAIPGTEEYLNSEKYEIRVRDWKQSANIREFIAQINSIRKANPALQQLANLRFLATDNEQIILYVKWSADYSNVMLIAVNLDPDHPHHCSAFVPPEAINGFPGNEYEVTDLLTDSVYRWGERNYIRLDPQVQPAHIFRVRLLP